MSNASMKSNYLRKPVAIILSAIMLMTLLAACSKGASNPTAETQVIRIGMLYGSESNEMYTRQTYTDMYELMYPNVEFQFEYAINYDNWRFEQDEEEQNPDPFEKLKEMLTSTNPVDVIIFDYSMLRRMTQDNLLQNLDPLVTQDKFDLTDYVPSVIDGIKQAGDNNLYALTPTFSASALYYNKKLFTEAGLSFPTDKMEWSEVLNLARQLSKGEGIDRQFGFSFNSWGTDGIYDTQTYAQSLQLKYWDDNGEKMLVNNDKWANAWETVASLYKEDVVPDQDFMNLWHEEQNKKMEENPNYRYYGDLFMSGKIAMTISGSSYVNELKSMQDNSDSSEAFDWDIVTVPVHPEQPEIGGSIYLSSLMGINAKAQNPNGAWEFIKFTNSKEWAKLKARSVYELVARKEFLRPVSGLSYNIDAFTLLKPIPPSTTDTEKVYREIPGIWEAQSPSYELFQKVLNGELTAKEALAQWETEGNAILERLRTEGPSDDGGIGIPRPVDVGVIVEGEATEDVPATEETVVE